MYTVSNIYSYKPYTSTRITQVCIKHVHPCKHLTSEELINNQPKPQICSYFAEKPGVGTGFAAGRWGCGAVRDADAAGGQRWEAAWGLAGKRRYHPAKMTFATCDDSVKNAQTGLEDFTGNYSWSEAVGGTFQPFLKTLLERLRFARQSPQRSAGTRGEQRPRLPSARGPTAPRPR